jgi:hypothetical protein
MNEHAGPACALSGLIVGIFAVLLHDHSPPPPVPLPHAQGSSAASPRGGESSKPVIPSAVRPTPSGAIVAPPKAAEEPSIVLPAARPREIAVAVPEPPRLPMPKVRPAQADAEAPVAPPKRPAPLSPRPTFAIVQQGESLAEVAVRVYGSKDATEALWKANRDQVERIDSPLARGTLLRVP